MPPVYTYERPADDQPLTAYLRRWSDERGHQRAFTFVEFPAQDSPGVHRTVSWERLYARARTVAEALGTTVRPGERAALLLPQGLDYVAAFLGCLYARVIAVPLFTPGLPGHADRLAAVLADCEPSCLLTDTATADAVHGFIREHGTAPVPVLPVDALAAAPAGRAAAPPAPDRELDPELDPQLDRDLDPEPDDIAYLQYTSGSTRIPAGVMISHRNVVANARQAVRAFHARPGTSTAVGWLPLFHDMGLVLSVAAPVAGGFPSVLMDPVAFLAQPARWLRLLGAYPGTLSAAPNFAYDYCATRIDPQQAGELRLERVRALLNGSEPVRAGTLRRFQETFAYAGLRPGALCPAYGLAEATVFVTADPYGTPFRTVRCDREALAAGRVQPVAAGADGAELVSCGGPTGQELRVVDPATGTPLPDGGVGEILVRGPNTGLGYWKQPAQSAETFGARVTGGSEPTGGEGDVPAWLRTGDLGALHEGQLLVTGRLKDLVIVDGRNHYPQDIEETVQNAADCVRRDHVAVFSCHDETHPERDQLVAVAEHSRGVTVTGPLLAEAARAAREHVSSRHGLRLDRLLLVRPGAVPRTSSGKVARAACRDRYLAGGFAGEGAGQ